MKELLKRKNTPTDNPSTSFPPMHTPSILKDDFLGLRGAPDCGERLETQNNLSPKLEEPPEPWWSPATPVPPQRNLTTGKRAIDGHRSQAGA